MKNVLKYGSEFLRLVFFFALIAQVVIAQTGNVSSSVTTISGVKISEGAYYTPYPAEPGKYIDLYVKVQSVTTHTIENLTCYVNAQFPFSIDEPSDGVYYLGNFRQTDIALMRFKVRINDNAVTGVNELKVSCTMKGFGEETAKLPIYIQAQDAVISITKVSSSPSEFKPNEAGTVALELSNIAGVNLKDITVKLDLSSSDIPFVPVNETIEKRISMLESGKTTTVIFNIKASSDASPKSYKVPVVLTYYDALGKSYSRSTIISLNIKTEPILLTLHDQTTIVKNGAKNTVPITIVNKGESKIAFTTVTIYESPDSSYTILSPNIYYVGDINSDDSESAEFQLFVNTSKNEMTVPIKITYKDEIGNTYEQTENVPVKVFSKEDAIKYGFEKPVSTDPLVTGIVVLIIIYLAYKYILPRFRKKKKTEFNE